MRPQTSGKTLEEIDVLFAKPGYYDSHHVEEKMIEASGNSKEDVSKLENIVEKQE
jgi:hypothetical protein